MGRLFFCFFLFAVSFVACSSVNDCECSVKNDDDSTVMRDYYDYEGSCSELEDGEDIKCGVK